MVRNFNQWLTLPRGLFKNAQRTMDTGGDTYSVAHRSLGEFGVLFFRAEFGRNIVCFFYKMNIYRKNMEVQLSLLSTDKRIA